MRGVRYFRERVERRQRHWEERFEREDKARREKHGPDTRLWAWQRLAMNLLALVATSIGGLLTFAAIFRLIAGDESNASYLLLAGIGFECLGQVFAWLLKHMR